MTTPSRAIQPQPPRPSVPESGRGSEAVTHGFRVVVVPRYVPEQSDPASGKYLFSYHINIANESGVHAQLISRRWVIVDGDGERHEVEGEGVIGEQPDLAPGRGFSYSSFCPLQTHWGTMEGRYTLQVRSGPRMGETFDIDVARFFLVAPRPAR